MINNRRDACKTDVNLLNVVISLAGLTGQKWGIRFSLIVRLSAISQLSIFIVCLFFFIMLLYLSSFVSVWKILEELSLCG